MCQKIPYATKGAALEQIDYQAAQRRHYSKKYNKHRKAGRKLRPYWCHICGNWHLTTRAKNAK